ncbi:phenol hydroxylase [Nanohaloarchaea archaeon]|nr:phenol hydroxylase [Candidatus Nanohaloarchaea archaeon]
MTYESATLTAVTQTTPTVKHFQFELEESSWDFEPGQHTVLRFEDDGEEVERPYTMINLPEEDKFALAIKKYPDGRATPWIHERQPGDEIDFAEPSGNLKIKDYDKDVVFISTGTGATPMYAMLRDYLKNGSGEAFYFHGEKTRETILFKDGLELLDTENDDLEVFFSLTDEEWSSAQGYVQEHVPEELDSLEDKHFYICGVPAMVVQTEELLKEKGVEEERIITEGWESDAV